MIRASRNPLAVKESCHCGDWMKEAEWISMTHRHRQQCGDGQREGRWGLAEGGPIRGNGDICNSANNKNKVKNIQNPGKV